MKQIVYAINVSKKPFLSAASDFMSEMMTVSRLSYVPDLIPMKSVCPMPQLPSAFNKSFEDVALERAVQIWNNHSKNESINVLWSGGIDSTVALIALLRTCPSGCNIHLYCNLNSIAENTLLYQKLVGLKNVVLKNSSIIPTDQSINFVTGELGDQIFGSDYLYRISYLYGFESIFLPYEQIVPKLFVDKCGEIYGQTLFDRYKPIVNESPFKINTAFDFIWWWNFSQKWQYVKFRKESLLHEAHRAIHFFESNDFQLWSIFKHDSKITKSVDTYKIPGKDFIFQYDKNVVYHKNKKKFGSPFGNKRHYYVLFDDNTKLHTWSECNSLIDKLTPQYSY